eukprot:17241-Heterococcus_DN1.PRE.2
MHCVTCARTDTEQQQQSLPENDKGASPSANGNSSATAATNGASSASGTTSSSNGTASFLLPVGSLAAIKNLRALCASQQLLVIAGDKASHTLTAAACQSILQYCSMALQKNWLRVSRGATDCGIVCELGVIRHISLMNKLSTAAVAASRNADADAAMNCCAMLLQGHTHMVELEGLREPHVAMHGSFSCMLFAEAAGGFALLSRLVTSQQCAAAVSYSDLRHCSVVERIAALSQRAAVSATLIKLSACYLL